MEFVPNPNQRRITIHKCDRKKNYSKIDVAANRKAMATLGYSAYMMYMLFCMNATDFNMILSMVAVCNETSLTRNVYYESFNKLVEKGYLVLRPNTKCLFDFYEDPSLACAKNPERGKASPQIRESVSQKQVENILNIENSARGITDVSPTGEEENQMIQIAVHKSRVFADI